MDKNVFFSSEVEQGNFLGSIDVIPDAYHAILKTSSPYKLHTHPSGIKVLAFHYSLDDTARFPNGEFELDSSENHKVVDFIATKANPSFSINKAAVVLFERLSVELKKLEDQLMYRPLVVTGRSVGGCIAILFALWLHHAVDGKESDDSKNTKRLKRPICLTFGSPLVGDERLQCAISERPQWKSSLLNVVAKTDPVPCQFSSRGAHKPLGTYLFCTESGGCTSFEDPALVLAVLDAMASSFAGKLQQHDYFNDLSLIKKRVLYRGVSELGKFNFNSFRAGITLQLMEVGVLDTQENNNWDDLISKMEAKQKDINKRIGYEPTKKLNDSKISLTYMEWYMKAGRSKGGYYDSYKNPKSKEEIVSQQEIVKYQRILKQYWENLVEEKDRMPQKEGAKLRTRWLLGGNNYRRIVEPLDIAEHYKKGKKNYMANRSNHYKLLEKWSNEDKRDSNPSDGKKKAASPTKDSCFWAHVEEALISLKDLKDGGSSSINADDNVPRLEGFESDVMRVINDYSVSSDIFLEGSTFMKWWREYKAYKGSSYASELAQYMNKGSYKLYN